MKKIPVIDVTDLYHPHQDAGDNFDIIMPYALPEIDLRAVILDATDSYRRSYADHPDPYMRDDTGPREPGVIPMMQMNYLFGENVPFAHGPFFKLSHPEDSLEDANNFQLAGVNLLLDTLRNSEDKVHILSFGSTRAIAVAYNREPELMKKKVAMLHLCAGAAPGRFLEWNVQLDPHAFVCLLNSPLPKSIYPCATEKGPWDIGRHNTYWNMEGMSFIKNMDPLLKRYLGYVFNRENRTDFLTALETELSEEEMSWIYTRKHSVWETAVWLCVSARKLVKNADSYRILETDKVKKDDQILENELTPIELTKIKDSGDFDFSYSGSKTDCWLYERNDPLLNVKALQEALPVLYESFSIKNRSCK